MQRPRDPEGAHEATSVLLVLAATDHVDRAPTGLLHQPLELHARADEGGIRIKVQPTPLHPMHVRSRDLLVHQPVIDVAQVVGLLENVLGHDDVTGPRVQAGDKFRGSLVIGMAGVPGVHRHGNLHRVGHEEASQHNSRGTPDARGRAGARVQSSHGPLCRLGRRPLHCRERRNQHRHDLRGGVARRDVPLHPSDHEQRHPQPQDHHQQMIR